jgi:excisionase family DNA binding protein
MPRRSYLTTFEISQICEVNPTTVQNWIKEKKLRAFLTPGGHRRVRREDFIGFMKEFGMPLPAEFKESPSSILIVDDEEEVLDLLIAVMESGDENLRVEGLRNGVEALLSIGERKPNLLILDIMMPGMNGFEVCEKLKSAPANRNLKIVAISGDHDPAIRDRILAAGADLFFAKPFDMMMFRAECLKLMNSPRAR